jgi:hypothetical protein
VRGLGSDVQPTPKLRHRRQASLLIGGLPPPAQRPLLDAGSGGLPSDSFREEREREREGCARGWKRIGFTESVVQLASRS